MTDAHRLAAAIGADDAQRIARLMAGLGTASRVRILGRLRAGPCSVGELTAAVEMAQPAVSHQLRILRDLGLVVGRRDGRHTIYGLHDSHVAMLVDEALRHVEHLRAAAPEPPWAASAPAVLRPAAGEHAHIGPHAHGHAHDGEPHAHAHTAHEHEHIEHAHPHEHEGEAHAHAHAHEAGLEDVHEHLH